MRPFFGYIIVRADNCLLRIGTELHPALFLNVKKDHLFFTKIDSQMMVKTIASKRIYRRMVTL